MDAMASAAAVRGSISAVRAHEFFVDKAGEPMCLASDLVLGRRLDVSRRLEEMVLYALTEAVEPVWSDGLRTRARCLLGLPEPRVGMPPEVYKSLAAFVTRRLGLANGAVQSIPGGHAAGLMAIQIAAGRISRGEVDVYLIAGVDSYYSPETLESLDEQGLLMSAVNRNGYPPGEAAGACILVSRSAAERYGLPILARIGSAATGIEPYPIYSKQVCVGTGLTAVLRSVTGGLRLPDEAVTATYCDLNGQRYRNEEYVYTLLRVQGAFVDVHDYKSPADCWGDVGAASGPLFACLAIAAMQRRYAQGAFPMLWAGSDSGYRSAVLLKLGDV
jgi:3-oxoacyl-[acyl-carrier-protein] synthase-1